MRIGLFGYGDIIMKKKFGILLWMGVITVAVVTSIVSAENLSHLNVEIASVNGVSITKNDFDWAFNSAEIRHISSGKNIDNDQLAMAKKNVLDSLINRELLFQESQNKNIAVKDADVDQEYDNFIKAMPENIDLKTLSKELELSESDIKNEYRRELMIQRLLDQELVLDDKVTEKEIKDFYNTHPDKFMIVGPVRVSHILIKADLESNPSEKTDALMKITAIQEKLDRGEDFAELAKKYSQGPSNIKGGDIGFIKPGQTVRPFEEVVFSLEAGEISDIVETEFGYHLIKILEKKPESIIPYGSIKEKIREYLKLEITNKTQERYIQKLKKKATIQIFTERLN